MLEPILANAFPDASIHTIERSLFNDQNGLAAVSRLMSTASSADRTATISHVRLKYYALGAANAVVEWLARQGMTWSKGCLDVQWRAVEGTMLMDNETIRDLELLTNVGRPSAVLDPGDSRDASRFSTPSPINRSSGFSTTATRQWEFVWYVELQLAGAILKSDGVVVAASGSASCSIDRCRYD